MAHVEDCGVIPTGEVLSDGAFGVRQRHLPAAEVDESGTEFDVLGMQ
jgi:hypothetical protein